MSNPNTQEASPELLLSELCPYCNVNPPKYRCPACSARSCSLACSKRHKVFNQCSGTRDPTKYVKKSQLMTPAALDRDYNYLTTVEKALNHTPVGPFSNGGEEKEHTSRMERVINEVQHRGTQVIQAPAGLKRARENMTVVTGSKKKRKTVKWTVEWIIREGADERRILDERVSENLRIFEAFSAHLNIPNKSERKQKTVATHFYLKNAKPTASRPTLISINVEKNLHDILVGKTVLEFPTIYVCDQVPEDFTIVDDTPPTASQPKAEPTSATGSGEENTSSGTSPHNSPPDLGHITTTPPPMVGLGETD